MSNNTIPPIDLDRENMIYYLRRLSQGLLLKEEALQLRSLLERELENEKKHGNIERINSLSNLIKTLNLYVHGKIDLYSGITDNMKLSNID